MLIDTHAHVNFSAYKNDGEEVLKRTLEEDVFVINVGSQFSTSKRAVEYAHEFKNGIWAAIGIHPVHLKMGKFIHRDENEMMEAEFVTAGEKFEYDKYLKLAKDSKVVAVGEVGLDYHHFEEGDNIEELKLLQKETLLRFIELANEVKKPIMLHCWDGYDDLLEILKKNPVNRKGVIHSFIGSHKTAKKFIELGYLIGLNGIVTYGDSYNRLIKEIDLDNIILETDCPYLTPRPLERMSRNEPLFVKHVAQKIAETKGVSIEEVANITTKNAIKIFNIK